MQQVCGEAGGQLPEARQFLLTCGREHCLPPSCLPDPPPQIPGLVSSGPTHWKEMAPACGGPAQSPINIDLHLVQQDPALGPFIFQGYHSAPPGPWTLENDGHTGQYPGARTPPPPQTGAGTHLAVRTTRSPPPPHTPSDQNFQSAQKHPHTLVKTPYAPHTQVSGPPRPRITISHCPQGPGVRTFPQVRMP